MPQIDLCKRCKAPISFVKLVSGKWNPVNIERHYILPGPAPAAERITIVTSDGEVASGRPIAAKDAEHCPEARAGNISHYATCPAAAEFRKGKKQ